MAYYNGKKVLSVVAVEYFNPNGTIKLTENGSYDVQAYKKAVVAVFPSGTIQKIEDEGVAQFASLPSGALPKGLINYVGGKSVALNQLAEVDGTYTAYGLTATPNPTNNTFTISGTSSYSGSGDTNLYSTYKDEAVKQGHKYLVASNSDNWCLYAFGGISSNLQRASIATASADGTASFSIRPINNTYIAQGTVINDEFRGAFTDLTDIYGAGNEPTSTSDPRIQRLINYLTENPQYNEGEIINAVVESILSKGFNQWDEEWEVGEINGTTGAKANTGEYIRSESFINVQPSTTYYAKSTETITIYQYDGNGDYIGAIYGKTNDTFTTASNCRKLLIATASGGTTYNHDICINLSGTMNGTYLPYQAPTSYPIPAQIKTLDGYGMGIDTTFNYIDFENKKFVKKVRKYTFAGNETWNWSGQGFWFAYIQEIADVISGYWLVKSLVSNGIVVRLVKEDNSIRVYAEDNSGISDQTDMNALMDSSVEMVYSIEAPTETDISEYLDVVFTDENLISLYQGGSVRFENESDMEAPYSLNYQERIN